MLEDLEKQKKLRLREIREKIEVEVRFDLEEYQKKISMETDAEISEIRIIKTESQRTSGKIQAV